QVVRDARRAEPRLEGARLGGRAEQDRDVAELDPVRPGVADDLCDDERRLVLLVLAGEDADRVAGPAGGFQRLLVPRLVVLDDGVRGGQDSLGPAVVSLAPART